MDRNGSRSLTHLEGYTNELATSVKVLSDQLQDAGLQGRSGSHTPPTGSAAHLAIAPDAPYEVQKARRDVLTNIRRLQRLLMGPDDLIQNLASQTQLLACLRWLAEFQVLACIPLNDTVPIKDIADLTGVPETELSRIVRMTSTVGFLAEPREGYIAHTALSAPYVTELNYLDAATFLAEIAVPASLQMAAATTAQVQKDDKTGEGSSSAYTLAFKTGNLSFQSACQQRSKLQRQWPAFLRCLGDRDDSVAEVLSRLDWLSLGSACVVDLCSQSTEAATVLADRFSALQFVVQLPVPPDGTENQSSTGTHGGRISVQRRVPGSLQTVKDAAVYMLRMPSPPYSLGSSPDDGYHHLAEHILAELRAHLGVLRANAAVTTFVLALRPLPEPGSVGIDVETTACVRDLSKMQLTNERDMRVGEVVQLVDSVQDGVGRLVVVNKLLSPNSATVAFVVKYHFDSS
ncbi:hypothetical protein V8F06_012762 [Rhypophila decipiens]